PALLARLHRLPAGLRETLAATLAAQLFTDPLSAATFGAIPVIGPLANLLAEPVVPLIMGLGALLTALGWLWEPAGQAVALVCWLPLSWMIGVVELLARLPGATWAVPAFGAPAVVLWYGGLG